MSSDAYFEDDGLDGTAFEELDAIEATFMPPKASAHVSEHASEDSIYDLTFDVDENELEMLDVFIEDTYQGKARPVMPSTSRTKLSSTVQTTLFGDILSSSSAKPRSQMQRTKSLSKVPSDRQPVRIKEWDQTAFAKSGLKQGKGKRKAAQGEDENEGSDVEFEQFPAPFVPVGPPPPMAVSPDLLEAKHWIYPLNRPKRDYQYNIVKRCLFDNTVVALPTGLGKTFIAGVVMLNYYRWFPNRKVVFVAPTKPLVAQQIDACHKTCGIPGSDAVELTGQVQKALRARAWREKRVFYMTPQTLVNDLISENCDVRNIVLLVIDEAHRATGDYAYNQVVRFLMAKNPHHRILALTATPGGNPEAVQKLIDGLHISRVEIRDENSLDLKQYIHHKTVKQHIVTMTEDVNKIKDLLAQVMEAQLKSLSRAGIFRPGMNPVNMHPYAAQARMGSLESNQKWAYSSLSQLATLARAMGYLIEGTIGMCHTYLQQISQEPEGDSGTGKGSKQKKLRNDPLFKAVVQEVDLQRSRGFSVHPKLDLLKTLVVQHFGQKLADDGAVGDDQEATRVMVFVTFREAVDEIVEALNYERPLIRAHKFIGQGTDKRGGKGLAQREQLEVIQRFKDGEFNVLVATSIGEEGLDIGEVDMIACYDAQKTPIRMLQRLGRTGRKRAGYVHVLLAEGREEFNMDKAKSTYKEVQKTIVRGDQLEMYTDVPRLLPDHIKPECLEKEMDIQEYVRDDGRKTKPSAKEQNRTANGKRKRNDDVSRNIPPGASAGFVSVADLLVKGTKKKNLKALPQKDFDNAGEDDDTDKDIESGSLLAPSRTTSLPVAPKRKTETSKIRRSTTNVPRKKKTVAPESSPFSNKGIDDADDLDIEQGHIIPQQPSPAPITQHSKPFEDSPRQASSHDTRHAPDPVIDLTNSEEESQPHVDLLPENADQSMAWLVDDDDEPDIEIVDSSPHVPRTQSSAQEADESVVFISANTLFTRNRSEPSSKESHFKQPAPTDPDDSPEFVTAPQPPRKRPAPSCHISGSSPSKLKPHMPPPIIQKSPSRSLEESPDASFPIRTTKRRRCNIESPMQVSQPTRKRLHRRESTPPQKAPKKRRHLPNAANPVFDLAAVHSGDEVSEGSSNSDDDVEDESDRLFLAELLETQVSPSYDQALAYRQSLFTQAPLGARAPGFASGPVRRGAFGGRMPSRTRGRMSSSPPIEGSEPDEYEFGSFVVHDEAEMSYLSDD